MEPIYAHSVLRGQVNAFNALIEDLETIQKATPSYVVEEALARCKFRVEKCEEAAQYAMGLVTHGHVDEWRKLNYLVALRKSDYFRELAKSFHAVEALGPDDIPDAFVRLAAL